MLGRLLATSPRFVLTIGNEGGLLAQIAGGRVIDARPVGTDEAAFAELGAVLGKRARRPLVVLIDLLEQSYRQESVPKVNRMDRSKVLARRLERAFPDAELRAALERGEDPDQRSTRRYLLAAVPPAPDWTPWVEFLRTVENPIVALTLLPVEAVTMVTRLARHLTPAEAEPHPWTILISRQSTGGVRQIVVNRGELALTRLTPSLTPEASRALLPGRQGSAAEPTASAAAGAGSIDLVAATQHELRATLGYMTRLGYRADAGLDIIVLGDDALRRQWSDAVPSGARLHMLSATEAAAALGLGRIDDAEHGTLLCAAWTARKRQPAIQLLPADLRRRMREELSLHWAGTGLGVSAIGLASYAAFLAVTGLELEHEIDWLRAWQATARSHLERDGVDAADGTASADMMRAVLQAYRRLQSDRLDPIAPLQALRATMARDEQLLSVGWQVDLGDTGGRDEPDDGSGRQESDDFTIDLVLDLGRGDEPSTAVAATDRFAARLVDGFPDRPILIKRQAVSILPNENFVGGAGLVREPASADAEMSAELRIGRRRR
jgi:hypothetical protein